MLEKKKKRGPVAWPCAWRQNGTYRATPAQSPASCTAPRSAAHGTSRSAGSLTATRLHAGSAPAPGRGAAEGAAGRDTAPGAAEPAPGLPARPGVGRCRYTRLPRLVKARPTRCGAALPRPDRREAGAGRPAAARGARRDSTDRPEARRRRCMLRSAACSQLGTTDGPRQIRRHSLCLRPGSVGLKASTDLTRVYRAAGGAWEYVQRVSQAVDAGATQAAGLAPAELTAANMDRSAALEQLLAGPCRGDEAALLGELQVRRAVQDMGSGLGLGRAPRCRVSRAVG